MPEPTKFSRAATHEWAREFADDSYITFLVDDCHNLLDALLLIRRTIRNSREAPNVLDTIDFVAREAIKSGE